MSVDDKRLLEYLKKVTIELNDARARLSDLEGVAQEPVAIVGTGCRLPGYVRSAEQLWELVAAGGDAVSKFPVDRGWDLETICDSDSEMPGTSCTDEGGFLYDAGEFDARFFGIGPNEAMMMDPQQRLLLEVSWEAIEGAGIDPVSLRGSPTAVFAGVTSQDYGVGLMDELVSDDLGVYLGTGSNLSVVSGRIAYVLGLSGAAMTVETACSSSLVALHLACNALRGGECSLALAGGVSVMATPIPFILMSQQRAIAGDGRCKAFAACADGAGFSEGAGMVLLERLSDAQRLEHEVLAVVRGSAVNQDGASNGLSAPSGLAQERVIRQALANASLTAAQVDVVEGHGTGTTLGDPIEAEALIATYGQGRSSGRPLRLGSLKSNIGHTQAAAGVAGVMKMVFALRHGVMPRTLHIDEPTPKVDWSLGDVALLTEAVSWERNGEPRRAGVSSFGLSGTNAHVIIEEAPSAPKRGLVAGGPVTNGDVRAQGDDAAELAGAHVVGDGVGGGVTPWVLSGAGVGGLRGQAGRLLSYMADNPELGVGDVGQALAGRSVFEDRAVVLGDDRDELVRGLTALAEGGSAANLVHGASSHGVRLAFLFTGQGAQRVGMGGELYRSQPLFAKTLNEVCECMDRHLGGHLRELMFGDAQHSDGPAGVEDGGGLLDDTMFTQPALFALEVALFRLLEGWGVRPDFLLGHSIGELVAAHVAGVLSLADACALVAARGRLMSALPTGGAMVAVQASEEEVLESLGEESGLVQLAAVNGPSSVVLSGDEDAVGRLADAWRARGRKTRHLQVSHAFHSHRMDGMLEQFAAVADGLSFSDPRIPIVSNVTGQPISAEEVCSAAYWVRHARETVRFADGVGWLRENGVKSFVELGPEGVLSAMCRECLASDEEEVVAVPVLRAGRTDSRVLVSALAELWVRGHEVSWRRMLPSGAPGVSLPTYAFQRRRYWLDAVGRTGDAVAMGQAPSEHPLLGAAVSLAGDQGWLFTGRISLQTHPWLADHAVGGVVLLPGTAFLDLALHAGQQIGCGFVEELALQSPLVLAPVGSVQVQVIVGPRDDAGRHSIGIHARAEVPHAGGAVSEPENEWTCHATGVLGEDLAGAPDGEAGELRSWPPEGAGAIELDGFYERLADLGLDYGPAFQGLRAAWRRGEQVFAEVRLGEDEAGTGARYGLHPGLLDAALHAAGAAMVMGETLQEEGDASGSLHLPFSWRGVRLRASGASSLRVCLSPSGPDAVSLTLADDSGRLVATVDALVTRPVSPAQLAATGGESHRSLYHLEWVDVAAQSPPDRALEDVVLIGVGESGSLEDVAEHVRRAAGIRVDVHPGLASLRELAETQHGLPRTVFLCCTGSLANEPTTGEGPAEVSDGRDWAGSAAQMVHASVNGVLDLLQEWLAEELFTDSRLVLLTTGALATSTEDRFHDLASAAVAGLLRSAQMENPGRFVLIDTDSGESLRALPAALHMAFDSQEPQLALRDGKILAPRLARTNVAERDPDVGGAFPANGTVLVTGGTGGLGGLVAKHLVSQHEVAGLILASRRGREAPGAPELEAELLEMGSEVRIVACDVSDREQLERLIASVGPERPLCAVVHTAGVIDDGTIGSLTPERVDHVLAPKTDAALHLHELTRELNLSQFVLFSSAAGTFGSPGQGSYAAANSSLDALAAHRHAHQLPATSIAWGLWQQSTGITEGLGREDHARAEHSGMRPLTNQEGLELLDASLVCEQPLLMPVHLDMGVLRAHARRGWVPPLLRGLVRVQGRARTSSADGSSLAARLAEVAQTEHGRVVLELVRAEAARVLGHESGEAIDVRSAFSEMGFDSLAATELRNRLSVVTGLRLPATLVFDYPTPLALAERLLEMALDDVKPASPVSVSVSTDEPIAIVGMSCRYPGGVRSPQELWELVASGVDAISGFPTDRGWDLEELYDPDRERGGTSYVREGGFLHDAGEFDAGFFRISPREALVMDPQQRLLLEACWEAFEDAGIDPLSLKGSRTGVFAGLMYQDYMTSLFSGSQDLDGYAMTGGGGSIITGRVAYVFGLEGPAVTVDTACSSSLVAMHLACQALRSGECSLALAGGVTVMTTPMPFVGFSQQGGLAPDARCKSFADGADGVSWGEGAGVVLLERLSEAQRLGHRVLAIVRGSAVNQDGASNGLMAPNGPSQQRVIAQALANAGLSSGQIDAVEGHGTGTTLGDPIEAQALLATYGQERPDGRPLRLGSIKSNIGHTQAAAGVAGVMKMVLALRHGVLPRTLHVDRPSGHVDWSAGEVSLLTEAVSWERNGEPRRAGVSSFGLSGTNAHVVIEEAPAGQELGAVQADPLANGAAHVEREHSDRNGAPEADGAQLGQTREGVVVPWVLSGQHADGLHGQAGRLRGFLAGATDLRVADIGLALAKRPALEHRAVALGERREDLSRGVSALAAGESSANVIRGVAAREGRLAFLFTGQGAQYVGMGRGLYERYPAFRAALDEVCGHFEDALEHPLRELMLGGAEHRDRPAVEENGVGLLDDTMYTQAALFALEVALFRVLESWKVPVDFLLGHSIGEIAAAHVAGVFSLEDAVTLVAARGRLMSSLPAGGTMVAVQASEQEALESLDGLSERVAVAAVNGPLSVVLSGEHDAVLGVADRWRDRGRKVRRLRVSHAFHSPQMDGILAEFASVAGGLSFGEPRIPVVSNVTGRLASAQELCSPDYWVRHVRETVRFGDGVRSLREQGVAHFLELGPEGVLSAMCEECLRDPESGGNGDVAVASVLRAGRPDAYSLIHALGSMWVNGAAVDFRNAFDESHCSRVDLPTYAFQRQRYWVQTNDREDRDAVGMGQARSEHPLLSAVLALPDDRGWLFTGRLSARLQPWLADHTVMGTVLLPGTALLEMALHAAGQIDYGHVRELLLEAPLSIDPQGAVQLQVAVGEADETGARPISIHSRPEHASDGHLSNGYEWTRNALGTLSVAGESRRERPRDTGSTFSQWPPAGSQALELDGLYERLAGHGLDYGPAFQGLRAAWWREEELFAEVSMPADQELEAQRYGLHPALLDASLHAGGAGARDDTHGSDATEQAGVQLPFSWRGVELYARGASRLRVRFAPAAPNAVSLTIADEDGGLVGAVEELCSRPVSPEQLAMARTDTHRSLYRLDWTEMPVGATPDRTAGETVLLGLDGLECSPGVVDSLRVTAGVRVSPARDLASVRELADGELGVPGLVMVDGVASEADGNIAAQRAGESGAGETPNGCVAAGALTEMVHGGVRGAVGLLQEWLAHEAFAGSRLVFVTVGALATSADERVGDLVGASVGGLLRSAQLEHPGRFVHVDLDGEEASWRVLAAALEAARGLEEQQFALRRGRLLVPRIARMARGGGDVALPADGTVLITGGTGGLGGALARHLASRHGITSLVLASRRGDEAPGARELAAELAQLGVQVRTLACDVSDRGELTSLIDSLPAERPLCAVVHAAGVIDDGTTGSLTVEQLDRVLAPKVDAALYLDELTRELDLSQFVLFSSAAGIFGSPGQGAYAAANALLDALATRRRAQGLPGISLAWGLWEQTTGITAGLGEEDRARAERSGVHALSTEEALELFDLAWAADSALAIPVGLDVNALRAQARSGWVPTLLRGLVRVPVRAASGMGGGALTRRLAGVADDERGRIVLELVCSEAAGVLGHASSDAVPAQRSFLELGFDSLAAVELRNRLDRASGLHLSPTLVFDHPTPGEVAEHLLRTLERREPDHGRSRAGEQNTGFDDADAGIESAGTFGLLFGQARAQGMVDEFLSMLTIAARLRPTFGHEQAPAHAPQPVGLSEGVAGDRLVCIPSLLATSGPHQYARFAGSFRGVREVTALALCGFAQGEPLPATMAAAVGAHAHAVRTLSADAPVVLLGHSTGGEFALAVAAELESAGEGPAAVILIDTYSLVDGAPSHLFGGVLESMLARSGAYVPLSDVRLTAMFHYLSLLAERQPRELEAPVLLLRASEPLPGVEVEEMRAQSWKSFDGVVDVPGDHFTTMEDHAGSTAGAVSEWLSGIADHEKKGV